MDIDFNEINYLVDPDAMELKADYEQFLLSLTGPTIVDITGKNKTKCRVITTLLHGNEPSGLIAMHRWLTAEGESPCPETNLRFIICSVEAASSSPLLTRRCFDGGKDINRCFGNSHDHNEYHRAKLIEKAINEVSPELVVDLHNTSGSGPAFAVAPVITPNVLSLTSFFCNTIILSGIQLGALMEQNFNCPMITVECGGVIDEQAHEVAFEGISLLASCCNINKFHQEKSVEVIYKPVRLQLAPHVSLSYSEHDEGLIGVTLKSSIEQFNFGSAREGQILGWVDDKGLENLEVYNEANENVVSSYFSIRGNQLLCATNLRIFMATTSKQIAMSDCLLYAVLPNGDTRRK